MKRFSALIMAVIMALTMTVTAFADEAGEPAPTYGITAPDNGHTYEVYQIFTGDLADGKLSNVKAGANAKAGIDVETALQALMDAAEGTDAQKLEVASQYVNLSGDPFITVAPGTTETVPAGYYLIKDIDGAFADKYDAYTLYILQVVGNVEISPKADIPEVSKKVKDTNDSKADSTTDWQDSADYDIGDHVPYMIEATLGDLSAYKTYYLEFVDEMSEGLTYDEGSAVVTIDGEELNAAAYTLSKSEKNGINVVISDAIALGAETGSSVKIEYTCTLNEKAKMGSTGNPNEVYLVFSNNPNKDGKGKTPTDKVIVFTYKVVANKIKEDKSPLKGAAFKLEKILADGTKKDLGTVDGTDSTTFEWKGIDDGIYVITETKTPAGYNTIEPITFEVKAEHDILEDNPQLTKLTGGDLFGGDVNNGSVTGNIVNKSGAVLPSTGGTGTTMIYLIGAICALGAAILLISRKRADIR